MKLTVKQLYDLQQLVKRGWCSKPTTACDKCLINSCRDNMWFIFNDGNMFSSVEDEELAKAEKLIKQHYMIIAENILLEDFA